MGKAIADCGDVLKPLGAIRIAELRPMPWKQSGLGICGSRLENSPDLGIADLRGTSSAIGGLNLLSFVRKGRKNISEGL